MIGSTKSHPASFILRRIAPAVVFTAALVITPAGPGAAETNVYSGAPISLELVDADLQKLLITFSDLTELVFVVDSRTFEMGGLNHLVTVDYEMVPWDQALDEILAKAGLEWTVEGKILWIHLPEFAPDGDRNFTGDVINLRLEDAMLADVLSTMSKLTELDIRFDPDIETTISVQLRGVPWDQVLDFILRISGFESTRDGSGIEVFKISDSLVLKVIATSEI